MNTAILKYKFGVDLEIRIDVAKISRVTVSVQPIVGQDVRQIA